MKIKITYPKVSPKIIKHQRLINFMKWPLLIAVVICPIINLITGGKAWSLVVLMSIYMAWDLVISRDLVEYNRISQFVKLITLTSLLLITIDVFLAPGWALEAVPILIFSGLIVTSVLFFTDIDPFIIVTSWIACYIIMSIWWINSGIGDDGYAY